MEIAWWKGRITLARVDLKFPANKKVGGDSSQPWYLQVFIVASLTMGVFSGSCWHAGTGPRTGVTAGEHCVSPG